MSSFHHVRVPKNVERLRVAIDKDDYDFVTDIEWEDRGFVLRVNACGTVIATYWLFPDDFPLRPPQVWFSEPATHLRLVIPSYCPLITTHQMIVEAHLMLCSFVLNEISEHLKQHLPNVLTGLTVEFL